MNKKTQATDGTDYITLSYIDRYPRCESMFPLAYDPHKKLEPCPFCGGKAHMRVRGDNTKQRFHSAFFAFDGHVFEGWIYCKNCGAFMHSSSNYADDVNNWIDFLANNWNSRVYFVDYVSDATKNLIKKYKIHLLEEDGILRLNKAPTPSDLAAIEAAKAEIILQLQSAKSKRALSYRKPCPCCGGTGFGNNGSPEYDNRYRKTGKYTNYAGCPNCGLETALVIADTPERANEITTELWNTRYIEKEASA